MRSNVILFLTLFVFVFLFATSSALAHSGCCSQHNGVRADGCGCNDGTSLSDTCSQYYTCTNPLQKNTTSTDTNTNTYTPPVYVPPTDMPNPIQKNTPLPTFSPTPIMKPTPTLVKKHSHKQSPKKPKSTPTPASHKSWWQLLFGW